MNKNTVRMLVILALVSIMAATFSTGRNQAVHYAESGTSVRRATYSPSVEYRQENPCESPFYAVGRTSISGNLLGAMWAACHDTVSSVTETVASDEKPVVTVPKEDKPLLDPIPAPTKDKTCKNKNSGKDGTPSECNAGKGQEKEKGKNK